MSDLWGGLRLEGDLRLEAPGGGTIRCHHDAEGVFVVHCSDAVTAKKAFSTLRGVYPPARRIRYLGGLRNPFAQDIDVRIGERRVLHWLAGKLPRVTSLRGVIAFLRS